MIDRIRELLLKALEILEIEESSDDDDSSPCIDAIITQLISHKETIEPILSIDVSVQPIYCDTEEIEQAN